MNGDPADDRGGTDRSSQPDGGGPPGTIVALLTPPGRGALAVVGVRGPEAGRAMEACFRPRGGAIAGWTVGRLGSGHWRADSPTNTAPEEVVVVRTAQGWEIHCHGGVAASAAILDDLRGAGAGVVTAAEWIGGGTIAAETLPLFSRTRGPRAARIVARQHAGALERAFADLAGLVARGDRRSAVAFASRLLAAGRIGVRLHRPWRVVVAGRVNAGKSSLVNALAGHARCIVSPVPGTTRDAVETAIVIGGWEVVLVDTAGTPDGSGRIPGSAERAGIERAEEELRSADLVIHVVEAGTPPPPRDGIVVWSKADLVPAAAAPDGVVATAAPTGAGIDELALAIERRLLPELVADPALLDGAVPLLERHLDRVRELTGKAGWTADENPPAQ